jgi:hypothetical protein
MSDRLTELVLGLQRMAENARMRGEDLRYTQQQETYEHVQWLDHQLNMVEKVRTALLEERKRFMPVEQHPAVKQDAIPKIVHGPRKAE